MIGSQKVRHKLNNLMSKVRSIIAVQMLLNPLQTAANRSSGLIDLSRNTRMTDLSQGFRVFKSGSPYSVDTSQDHEDSIKALRGVVWQQPDYACGTDIERAQ